MKLAIALCLLCACTDFQDVQRGVCGNGLLEPGEDCDSSAANCVRCAVTCATADQCPSDAYACGVDGFCHAPGGELADPSPPVTFQVDDLRITDADRDGIGDVIGVSKTSIVVRNGDAAGSLAAATSFVTPAPSGPPAFGDLDGDGRIDITLPTPDGIVSYTSKFGVLAPVAIESPLFNPDGTRLDFLRLFAVGRFELGGLVITPLGNNQVITQLVVIGFAIDPAPVFGAAPCAARLGGLTPDAIDQSTIDIYKVTADGALDTELVLSFLTTTGTACVTSIHGNVIAGFSFDDITPTGANTMSTKPILADLDTDSDPCPGLINSDGGAAALRQWDGATQNGHCTLQFAGLDGAPLPVAAGAPATARAIGRIELAPQIPGVGRDTLVLSSGVYGLIPGAQPAQLVEIYSTNGREMAFVASADLDNDNDLDAVLATADQDDLDVLFRFPLGLQLFRIDTASQTTSLTLGDFDGNGVRDIAYTETAGDHQDMLIAYGTSDRPLAPVRVATFSNVGSVGPISFPDSVDTLDIADDLALLQPAPGGGTLLSLLHGSPQRTMISFFDPRTDKSPTFFRKTTVLRGAAIGNFVDQPSSNHRDLLAIGAPLPGTTATMRAWPVAGTDAGLDNTPSDGVSANGIDDCTGAAVCVRNAELLAWPAADHDLVIAIDREPAAHAVVLDPSASSLSKTELTPLIDALPQGVVVRSLHAADLDGDGQLELIASFQSSDGAAGEVRVCTMSAAGVPQSCEDLTLKIQSVAAGVTACIDAAPATLHDGTQVTTAAKELVVLCRESDTASLFKLSGDAVTELEAHAAGMTAIQTGDVTGDGIDDIVALVGQGGSQTAIVFAQCTSRQVGACGKVEGP